MTATKTLHITPVENNKFLTLKFASIVFATLVSSRLWSFQSIPDKVYDILEAVVALMLIVIMLTKKGSGTKDQKFNVYVNLFTFIPLVSALSAAIFHNQELHYSIFVLRVNFFWLLYFTLHAFEIPAEWVLRLLLFIGFGWIFLTVVQQFTYPVFFFYTRPDEEEGGFFRAGSYRFMVEPFQFGLFVAIYYYWKFLIKPAILPLLLIIFSLAGVYYYSTRQVMIGLALCMGLGAMMQKSKTRFSALFVFTLFVILGFLLKDVLFKDYVEMTNSQLADKDDVRVLCSKFFLFDYWPNWLAVIFGNGMEHANASYGKELYDLSVQKGFYKTDVGIIGTLNTFGIFYVLTIVFLLIKTIRMKLPFQDAYLKLFFWFTLALLTINEQFSTPKAIPFYCFIFYLLDKAGSNDAASLHKPYRKPGIKKFFYS